MIDSIYHQVHDAINRKLYVSLGKRPSGYPAYWRPIKIDGDDIVMLWGDCGIESNPNDLRILNSKEWRSFVDEDGNGLFKKVGFWDFTPAHDPAADCIAEAHRNPWSVGRELYELRKLAKAKGE